MKRTVLASMLLIGGISSTIAQQENKRTPESTEMWKPVPRTVNTTKLVAGGSGKTVPSDAIILFDGTNLNEWKSAKTNAAATWSVENGAMTVKPGAGDIKTQKEFEDFQLHIEFRSPEVVKGEGQGRGNSGVFLQGIYELQVLDSYNNPTYSNGQAGSIYKQTMPMVNASRKAGEWQTFDIIYTAPKFNNDGLMLTPPYVTVLHNGVLIHNHKAIHGPTPYVGLPEIVPHGKGPIVLQDHNDLVSYRNVWIRPL